MTWLDDLYARKEANLRRHQAAIMHAQARGMKRSWGYRHIYVWRRIVDWATDYR